VLKVIAGHGPRWTLCSKSRDVSCVLGTTTRLNRPVVTMRKRLAGSPAGTSTPLTTKTTAGTHIARFERALPAPITDTERRGARSAGMIAVTVSAVV
jgi:hypothetical protein